MSTNIVPSLEALPTELLHQIFDNLDAQTIIFTMRLVCRLFRSRVNRYTRYVLNMNLISKSSFYVLCRLIHPGNVISLILSNDDRTSDQIDLFISFGRLRQFTRLRSITLLNIDESQLNSILKRVNLNFLTSFSFNIRKSDDRYMETTTNHLSSLIRKPTLRKLEFNLQTERMSEISWPVNCTIHRLVINGDITIDTLCTILQCSIHLHTLIITQNFDSIIKNTILAFPLLTSFRQLTSLTVDDLGINMDKLESFLLLTPSIIYLKLINGTQMMDGKRWEQFIEMNLPQLNKFEFYFHEWRSTTQGSIDLEFIISTFRTPFWIEHKKWFVTCEYYREYSSIIHLYSLPICKSCLKYEIRSEKTSLSTYPKTKDNDRLIMANVNSLCLTLDKALADHIQERKETTNQSLFSNVNEIDLQFREDWPLLSLQSLSMVIDISQIVHMKLNNFYFNDSNQSLLMDIGKFMEQAHNLSSLVIKISFYGFKLSQIIENIHSIIPRYVKDVQIPMNNVNQIKRILERCQHLSTIKFEVEDTKFCEEVIKWFAENTVKSTCQESYKTVAVWLGRKRFNHN